MHLPHTCVLKRLQYTLCLYQQPDRLPLEPQRRTLPAPSAPGKFDPYSLWPGRVRRSEAQPATLRHSEEQRNSAHAGFVGCGRESRLALVAQDAAARFGTYCWLEAIRESEA